jgi:cob(I)alamin adenosyltransferase
MKNRITEKHIETLESAIDDMENRLAPLTTFILPCGSDGGARLHFARAKVRVAEISLIDLNENHEPVRPEILKFFNRLSDYLFVMARLQNAQAGANEIHWSGLLETN